MAKGKKKRGVPPPKDETKEQRFIRVCTPRVRKAVKMMDNIANCSGAAYVYTEKQVNDINATLTIALDNMLASFTKKKVEETVFDFKALE